MRAPTPILVEPRLRDSRTDEPRTTSLPWPLLGRIAAGLVGLVVVGAALGWVLRDPISWAGTGFIELFGLWGLGGLTLAVDASPVPLTNEPLMVLALGAGVDGWTIFGVISSGSVLAGLVGWCGGRLVGTGTPLGRWLVSRYPGVQLFMRRWGALGVAIAALTPIPFGLTAWTAGMTGVPAYKVGLASLARVPKTGFYLWLVYQGWVLGG
jgi:membrane protein YqaA with SNARE-associated domain